MPLAAILNLDFIYLFFNILLLLTFIIAGYNVSKGSSYWKNAWTCIIIFVFVLGSRYNRGNDYAHYVDVYNLGDIKNQYLFWLYNSFLKDFFGVWKYAIFYFYALPFIWSGFKFLKNFKKHSNLLFPLFLIAMIYFEEYEIRQSLGFTFVFLFLDTFMKSSYKKKKKVIVCSLYAICTIMVHSANIIFIALFLCLYYSYHKILPYYISIPLLIFCTYIFVDFYNISFLVPILHFLGSTNSKFSQYTEGNAAEAWFGESAYQLDNKRNPIILIFEIIGNASLFYFSYRFIKIKEVKNGQFIVTLTNLYILGFCSKQAFLYLEILNRMSGLFQQMWFIPLAFVLSSLKWRKLNFLEKVMFFSMIFIFDDYIKYLFFPPNNMTLFLWDRC
jgi:hypothetical protein